MNMPVEAIRRLCSICARAGSKGVKNKNIRALGGKPLIAHSILQARRSSMFDLIAVSSDSREILDVALEWGADLAVVRPPELATDSAPKLPAIRHCAAEAERVSGLVFDTLVDLDCSSPLRNVDDVRDAVRLLESGTFVNILSVTPARRSPYMNLLEIDENGKVGPSKPLPTEIGRRQDAPKCYDANASIYAWNRKALFESESLFQNGTGVFIMPEERSFDIDSELDWEIVSFLSSKREDLC